MNFWRIVLFIIGTILEINGILLTLRSNFNLGNLMTLGLGAIFLAYGIWFERVNKSFPKWLKIALSAMLCGVIGFSGFLLCFGFSDNVDYKEDAIIVLGAAVHGDVPSVTLKGRLNKAVEYYEKNPDVVIIVSGGMGPQENVTEAYAMEKYLVSKGVPKEKIFKEERATSTYENFLFSKEILDGYFFESYTIAFITNEYHVYRAGGIAKKAGFKDVTHFHSNTLWHSVVTGTLRECLAVVKFWVLGP